MVAIVLPGGAPSCWAAEKALSPGERKGRLPVRVPSVPRALPFPSKGGLFIHRHTVHPTLNENLAVKTQLVKKGPGGGRVEHPPRVGVPCREGAWLTGNRRRSCVGIFHGSRRGLTSHPPPPAPGIHNVRPPNWTAQARFVFPRTLPCSAGSCCSNLA